MACKKLPFRSRDHALAFLRTRAYPNKVTGQVPVRAYKCPACKQWHVTSKTKGRS